MRFAAKVSAVTTAAALTALTLTSCGTTAGAETAGPDGASAPSFAGPYASEFRQAWIDADSEFIRNVIEDETISDQEFSEIAQRLTQCVASRGMTLSDYDDHGGYSVDVNNVDGAEADSLLTACDKESGWLPLSVLRENQLSNPENRDQNEVMAECLVREGIVAPGYTADDFARDNPERSFPYLEPATGDRAVMECQDDPLGLASDQ